MKNEENANNNINTELKSKQKNKKEDENSVIELNYHKLQIENAKKDNEINKLREEIQQFKKYGFDTSSSFPWPDEFKNRWETFVRTMIMDNFENINSNYILLMKTVNIIVKIIYDISKTQIRQKTIELLKCLGLKDISDINISNFYNKFQRLLFQDFFKTLFIVSNDFYNSITTKIKNEIYNNKKIFNEKEIEDILRDLTDNNIVNFITELYFLCLYMNINEPKLTIKTSTDINYRYYKKSEYDIIEGFGKENDICIIILNPPMLGYDKPFKGLKPAVFIIENPSKDIIDICEKQKDALFDGAINNQNKNYNDVVRKEKVNIGEKYYKNNFNLFNQKIIEGKTILNNKNINNISSEIKYNSDDNININISNKINNDNNYKEKKSIDALSNKNISKTIKKGDILKIKNSSDYFLKKYIINPINIQNYIKKSEEKKEKFIQKKLQNKLKYIHFIRPQKISINYTNKKQIKQNKNNSKKVDKIEIERNASLEINYKKYNNTETNVNLSTPLANSILDTANNMMKILAMKKKLGLLFYSHTKSPSPSPSIINNKNGVSTRAKKRINHGQVGEFVNQLSLERNKERIMNSKELNKKEIVHERICTEIKKRNNDEKNQMLDSIKNNLNERLSYNNNYDKRKINNQINSNFKSNNYIINNNLDDNTNNINNLIINGNFMNTILQNKNSNENEFNKSQNNNFKNINNVYDLNNNLNNKNLYNNKENIKEIKEKYFLRRRINNSISLTRQKHNIDKNININTINNTSNNNNININININNNNANNGHGSVLLNYESDNVIKTEPDKPIKRIEKSFRKIRKNNSKNNPSKKKVSININNGINSYINKNKNKSENQNLSIKSSNIFNPNSNLRSNKPINIDDYINPIISYDYINTNNSENNCKYTQINIKKNNNIYQNDSKLKEISKKSKPKNNNAYINLNTDDYIKNKYKNSVHKSMNNFNNNNKKYYSNNQNNAKDIKRKSQKTISYDQLNANNQVNIALSLEKSKNKLYLKNFNNIFNNNNTINYNEIQSYSLNENSHLLKKFNKKEQNPISKNHIINNKNSYKDKNKLNLLQNYNSKGSFLDNKIKKADKNINQYKTIKYEINSNNPINNNFEKGKFTKDNKNNIYKNSHYKTSSSDGIKNYFYEYKYKMKNKNDKQKNYNLDSQEKIYDRNIDFKHKKNLLTLPIN